MIVILRINIGNPAAKFLYVFCCVFIMISFLDVLEKQDSVLNGFPPLNDSDKHNDNGNNQQDMNKITDGVTGHQSQHPQNQQHNSNRPQHRNLLFYFLF